MLEPHCPALEYVALLSHDAAGSYWWRFRTTSWGGERVEQDRAEAEEYVCEFIFPCAGPWADGVIAVSQRF